MPVDASAAATLFVCTRCGECCRGYGGTYLTAAEVADLARYLRLASEAVLARYCRLSGGRPLIAQREDGYCVFWDDLCTIHPVKPRMCRQWPFIPAVVHDPGNWFAMARGCPGMCTDLSPEQVRRRVAAVLAAGS